MAEACMCGADIVAEWPMGWGESSYGITGA